MVAMGVCRVSTTGMYTSRLAQCRTLSIIHGLSHGHTLPHIGTHRYTSIKRHTARQCHTGYGTPLPNGHLPFLQEYIRLACYCVIKSLASYITNMDP